MSVLAALNNHLDLVGPGMTTADTRFFDPSYVPYGIDIRSRSSSDYNWGWIEWGDPGSDTIWCHFTMGHGGQYGGGSGFVFEWQDVNQVLLARLDASNGLRAKVFGSTTVEGNASPVPFNSHSTYDVKISTAGGTILCEVYRNGVLESTATAAGTFANPSRWNIRSYWAGGSSATYPLVISELIAADEDTRGWRYAQLAPDGAGAHSDAVGGHAEIGDSDDTTLAALKNAADKLSVSLSAYGGATEPDLGVKAVIAQQRINRAEFGPQDARNFLRIGGADYNGASLSPGTAREAKQTVWALNPATGVEFTTAELAALELGTEALA